MKKNLLHIGIWTLMTLLVLMGCEPPQVLGGLEAGDDKVKLELTLQTNPYQLPLAPRTRANGDDVISTIWLLVFRGNDANATFVEAVLAENEGGKSYVEITRQTNACQLLALGNQQGQFYANGVAYDFTKANLEVVLANMSLTLASKTLLTVPLGNPQTTLPLISDPIPMSGLVSMSQISFTTPIPPINMKRAVAEVVVRNTDSAFKFLGITTLLSTPKQAQWYNIDGLLAYNTGSSKLVDYKIDASYSSDFLAAVDMGGNIQSTEDNPVRVFESDTDANDTYLLIRGTWQGETMYYKMRIVDSDKNSLNIERNTVYTLTITRVNARGFATVSDALSGKPSNTALDFVITVQDNWSYEISSNNEYYIGVSNSHLELYAPGGTTQYTAFTLVTNCNTQFVDRKHIRSLTSGLTIVAPTSDSYGAVIPLGITTPLEVKVTVTSAFKEGTLEIHLGSIKKYITVRRRDRVAVGTTISSNFSLNASAYYASAYVEGYPMTDGTGYMNNSTPTSTPNTANWLQLSPGGQAIRNDPHHVYSDTGLIDLHVVSATSGTGTVYVSTGKTEMQRIKVIVTM